MSSEGTRLPSLELLRFGTTELELSLAYPWNDEIARLCAPLVSEGRFLSGRIYTVQGQKHLVVISAWRDKDDEASDGGTLRANISIDTSGPATAIKVPKPARREPEFVSRVLALTEQTDICCTVEFVVESVETAALWFPLPTVVGGTAASPDRYEIRGVRGAKLSGAADDEMEFGFIMDRPGGRAVYLDLHFHMTARFTLDIPRKAIDRGQEIARQLVGTTPTRRRKPYE